MNTLPIPKTPSKISNIADQIIPPNAPREWTLKKLKEVLSRPLPPAIVQQLQGRGNPQYVPWYKEVTILDKYAPGWSWQIVSVNISANRYFLVGRLTVLCSDGDYSQDATGSEILKEEKPIKVNHPEGKTNPRGEIIKVDLVDNIGRVVTEPQELAYGDPSSNAESMAFRRAAAKFGLALYLYDKK